MNDTPASAQRAQPVSGGSVVGGDPFPGIASPRSPMMNLPTAREASLTEKLQAVETALSKKLEEFIKSVQATGAEIKALSERTDALRAQIKALEDRVGRV